PAWLVRVRTVVAAEQPIRRSSGHSLELREVAGESGSVGSELPISLPGPAVRDRELQDRVNSPVRLVALQCHTCQRSFGDPGSDCALVGVPVSKMPRCVNLEGPQDVSN